MNVGQIEKATQARVLKLFRQRLGYRYLGHWADRKNSNIELELLTQWLQRRGVADALISRALHEFTKVAGDSSKSLYDRNRAVYEMLRYGIKVQPGMGENHVTVWLIDWHHPEANDFGVAEEVTVQGADLLNAAKAATKRPDVVLYVNGMALGVLELKRSTVSVSEGIRQNLDNQKKEFIQPFFTTMQWVMAGNDSEGLRYATTETPEKYWLQWVEPDGAHADEPNPLDRHLLQVCNKARWLELIHDFIVFDAGTKKVCRQNQYFGIKAAQDSIRRREGGIIWHTQGSGKSLTMVWLAKWIRENRPGSRVLIITDRTELDEQIEKVFAGVSETICRTKSGADLVDKLNGTQESLLCALVHKFGRTGAREEDGDHQNDREATQTFMADLKKLPANFQAKGDLYVFVDECHRTQSGDLHKAMKTLLPSALFIGFTGTPLLKADKQKSIEVFGRYIHTYKFDQAVHEGVVLDLRYEARDIEQSITSQAKIDQWFEAKTQGLNDLAKAQLKKKWGTMQSVLSSQSRLEQIVADILLDMATRPRLMDGHGNAMLVAGSIFEACKFYELFAKTELKGKCAIVTSYVPNVADAKGETTGAGDTDNLSKYQIYGQMLSEWFNEPVDKAIHKAEKFELEVKKKFIDAPGQMKLLIVVDKLLTGFDAPSATYLYIDKQMRDHGLFQAICRVNRLDGDDKEYGYIIDYKDLFKRLENAVEDYTSGALDGYDKADVAGLLENRLQKGREHLEDALETVRALCEAVQQPRSSDDYRRYFCAQDSGNAAQLKDNEPKRLQLYKHVAALIRAFAAIANELEAAGYTSTQAADVRAEVAHYSKVRDEVKLSSGDHIDLKAYEPAMRHLIDTYIRAEASEKISAFDNFNLIELLVQRGPEAVDALPERIRKHEAATAETIENNVRRVIINESPIDPAYYDKMSKLLDALIEQRRKQAIAYQDYLKQVAELSRQVVQPHSAGNSLPYSLKTAAQKALYNNLWQDETLALRMDEAIRNSGQDNWQANPMKTKRVLKAIRTVLEPALAARAATHLNNVQEPTGGYTLEAETTRILELAKQQHDH